MHALGQYLTEELKARGWSRAEFARRADLSRQNVYQLLDNDRTHLGRLLEERTAQKIAASLDVPIETIWLKCMDSLGVPAGAAAPRPPSDVGAPLDASLLSDDVLAEQVRIRLTSPTGAAAVELTRLRILRARLQALVDNTPTDQQTVATSQVREVLHGG